MKGIKDVTLIYTPIPYRECNHYVLQTTCTNKKFLTKKNICSILQIYCILLTLCDVFE